jgi:ATP/maltotriose-dependent transcriptional regulator MalT
MNAVARAEIMTRYRQHAARFDRDTASRQRLGLAQADPESTEPALTTQTQLSLREQDVLELVAQGLSDNQIAREAGISTYMVKTHLKRVYSKLAARNRAHAVALGVSTGLLRLAAA